MRRFPVVLCLCLHVADALALQPISTRARGRLGSKGTTATLDARRGTAVARVAQRHPGAAPAGALRCTASSETETETGSAQYDSDYAALVLDDPNVYKLSPNPLRRVFQRVGFRRSQFDAEIFALGLPTLGAVLIDPCLSLVDTMFVGRLGAVALGAIGPCTALFNFVFATASCVLMVSTSVLVSKYKAVNNKAAMGRTIAVASVLGVLVGSAFATLFCSCPRACLGFMGASEALMPNAVPYLQWRAAAMPASMFLLVAGGAFRGIGDPAATLRNGALVGLLNVILDPLLMFPMGLGVAGAAIATDIAQWVGMVAYMWRIYRRREEFGLGAGSHPEEGAKGFRMPSWVPTLRDVSEFAGAGGSLMLRQICNVGCWTLMASVATRMGIYEIAAHQLMLSLWLVIGFAQDAVGVAGQVMVAQKLGVAREAAERGVAAMSVATARAISKRVLQLSLLLGLGLAGASRVVTPWALPYVCRSKEVVQLVSAVFPMALTGFPLCCVVWTWDSLFYGASDFLYNARTIAVASAIGAAGVLASLRWHWGLAGLWLSMTYAYFGPRLYAHYRRFNDSRGPFGESTADLRRQSATAAAVAT